MTCHFNLRHMISVHVSALFKQTSHYESNQYLSVITVPKNLTSTYISNDFSNVHISKDFSLRNQSGKIVSGQWGTDSTVYRKYPSLAKNQDGECSSPDTADHPSDTPRLLLLPYLVRQIFGHDRRKHTTIEKQENRQSTEDKTKKQRVGRR